MQIPTYDQIYEEAEQHVFSDDNLVLEAITEQEQLLAPIVKKFLVSNRSACDATSFAQETIKVVENYLKCYVEREASKMEAALLDAEYEHRMMARRGY